ncbi:MAG: MBL fold metallo-hydrolase [Oscillospiraceae bacterium]|jgi:competence protein ComEC|nr:MBL fold metallo-hydrolase [Oscillospiraceae bacterium]
MQKGNTQARKSVKNKAVLALLGIVAAVSVFITANGRWHEIYSFFGLSGNKAFASSDGVSVHFIDVGQGDCALIITPENNLLIDSGEREYSGAVINYLRAQGVRKLDFIIVSHPHSDHIGGMGNIINEFGADRIIMPRVSEALIPTTTAFERLLDSISNSGTEVIWAESGMIFDLGNNSRLEVIAPFSDSEYEKLNDYSIVAKFTHTAEEASVSSSFLFTGDIESIAENDITDREIDIRADVLHVAHHGSLTSSTAKFLNMVSGRYAVISVGSPNSYNHPRDEVLNRIERRDYEILRTDLHGNIVFDCTAGGLSVYVQKGNA